MSSPKWTIELPVLFYTHADITIPPRSVNISINEVAEFNCTAAASGLIWKSNGQQIHNGDSGVVITPTQTLSENIRMSTLRMTVTSTDNATNITCIAYSKPPTLSAESGPALLLVQGMKLLPATIVNSHNAYRSVGAS